MPMHVTAAELPPAATQTALARLHLLMHRPPHAYAAWPPLSTKWGAWLHQTGRTWKRDAPVKRLGRGGCPGRGPPGAGVVCLLGALGGSSQRARQVL